MKSPSFRAYLDEGLFENLWNRQCGVLRHNPHIIQINIGANLPQRGSYSEVHKSDREQAISTSTASFTRLSDPYSDKNPSLFLPS